MCKKHIIKVVAAKAQSAPHLIASAIFMAIKTPISIKSSSIRLIYLEANSKFESEFSTPMKIKAMENPITVTLILEIAVILLYSIVFLISITE